MINDPKNPSGAGHTGFQSSAGAQMLEKQKREKENRISDLNGHIAEDQEHLRAEENTLLKLRIQLNRVKNNPKPTVTVNSSEIRKQIEKLTTEIEGLQKILGTKRQESEKLSKVAQDKQKLAEQQNQLNIENEKHLADELVKAENRIKAFKENILRMQNELKNIHI